MKIDFFFFTFLKLNLPSSEGRQLDYALLIQSSVDIYAY